VAKKKQKPKVELLLTLSFDSGRIKVSDAIDYLEEVREITKSNPDSHLTVIESGDDTYFVIYRKNSKRVTENDVSKAIGLL
jgi:predicted ferric reductase